MKAVCQLLPFLFFLSLTVLLLQVSGLSSFLSNEYNLLKAAFQLLRFPLRGFFSSVFFFHQDFLSFFLSFFLISILNFAYYSEANFILFCC